MPDLARDLRAAEDELAPARRLKANLAAFINNETYDLHFRTALAQAVGLPRPSSQKADPTTQENRCSAKSATTPSPAPTARRT